MTLPGQLTTLRIENSRRTMWVVERDTSSLQPLQREARELVEQMNLFCQG